MAITSYTGLPGSGKSYGVVANVLIPAFEQGRLVVTNVTLNIDEILDRYPDANIDYQPDLTKFTGEELCEIPNGALIVIDEVWALFPSGMTAKNAGAELQSFLTEHRHRVENGQGQDIVFVTQDLQQICAFARNLVDKTFKATKLDALGQSDRFKIDIYQGAVTGQNPPERLKINKQLGQYKPEVYALYKSHTKGDGSVGSETSTDDRTDISKKIKLMIGAGLCVAAIAAVMSFKAFAGIFGDEDTEKTNEAEPLQQILSDQEKRQKDTKKYSSKWRIVGVVEHRRGSFRLTKVNLSNGLQHHTVNGADACSDNAFGITECNFMGEVVTQFTGNNKDFEPLADRGLGDRVAAASGW